MEGIDGREAAERLAGKNTTSANRGKRYSGGEQIVITDS